MTHQEIWDDCLIRSWKSDMSMNMLIKQFISNIEPDLLFTSWMSPCYFKDDFDPFLYITQLGIKRRCMDRNSSGELAFYAGFGGVRAFIAKRSPQISNRLFDGWAADDVISQINTFKWSRSNIKHSNKKRYDRSQNKTRSKSVITIKQRDIANKFDWGVVS